MPSDEHEMAQGLRLAAVAVISAVITATAVIGAGHVWISRSIQPAADERLPLIRTSG